MGLESGFHWHGLEVHGISSNSSMNGLPSSAKRRPAMCVHPSPQLKYKHIYINKTKSNRNISSTTHFTVTIILKINSRMDIHSMILVGFDFVAQCLPCRTCTVGFHNLKRFLLRYQQPLLIHPFMHRWITF